MRRRLLLATAVSCVATGLGAAVVAIQPVFAFAALERVFPDIVWRVAVSDPVVALSFDDGPDAESTPRVLEILDRYDAKATFFLIGGRALRNPELVQRVRARGHEVGNHYIADGSALADSKQEFLAKLARTEAILGLSGQEKLHPR